MSEEPTNGGGDAAGEDDFMEIEWDVLEAAIDAMADAGLDLADPESASEHIAILLASLLRRVREEDPDVDEEQLSEMAADVAAIAVEIALGEDEVPPFEASEE